MKNEVTKVLIPEYLKSFKCTGSECTDTCCYGWNINIDKKTYKSYTAIKDKEFKKLFKDNIKRNRDKPWDESYGYIKMASDNTCPFLSEKKLCKVHSELGEKYLSKTCFNYPRISTLIDNDVIMLGSISCPELARLALLNKSSMKLSKAEYPSKRLLISRRFDSLNPSYKKKPEKHFKLIRDFSIWIIQNRNYKITERIIILGKIIEEIDTVIKNNNSMDIPSIIQKWYSNLLKKTELNIDFPHKSKDLLKFEIKLVKLLLENKLNASKYPEKYSKFFTQCFEEYLCGISSKNKDEITQAINNYTYAYNNYFKKFLEEYEYIFENLIVNDIYINLFPFGRNKSVLEEYLLLVMRCSFIKVSLTGLAGYYKEDFNVDLALDVIVALEKLVGNNPSYREYMLDVIKDTNNADIEAMVIS
ncbi:flagellin lysine-N-methylase [Clostridium aestuarii]|uniref:Flagellin lysine-N-methylase n=1 Tax=Clostridium aestuarii TaxID=338193 RepID=A0ABT4D1L0_9CLOT|nr:flagellin lysine-N-methylase [Clostridium aestuarii]MCY6484522.1 flagellin lysine-N-methylase [Clostridium aestuarii]